MVQSLKEFKNSYIELLLTFLWRQWSALGVAGYADTQDRWFIDPEALLIFTCSIGRYDPRLFDEVLDWIDKNGNLINVQRLKKILQKKEYFTGRGVLSAIADVMWQRHKSLKWKGLSQSKSGYGEAKNLFLSKDDKPMMSFGKPDSIFEKHNFLRGKIEFRGHTQSARTVYNTGFLVRLRALLGVNARCEIILYLLTHESAHPRLIARETYYSQKTVQDMLVEMTQSDLIFVRPVGREKHYWLNRNSWMEFFKHSGEQIQWVNWPMFFSALEDIKIEMIQEDFLKYDPLLQSSKLRVLMQKVRPKIESAGFAGVLSDDRQYLAEDYIGIFLSDINKLLSNIIPKI